MLTLYSRPGCAPCDALKKLLKESNIVFTEVSPSKLSHEERVRVFVNILEVSRISEVSIPAVCITHGDHAHWVSGNGKDDVTEMFSEIVRLLNH